MQPSIRVTNIEVREALMGLSETDSKNADPNVKVLVRQEVWNIFE